MPLESGVAFRVWAPHADSVSVAGSFNDWQADADPMEHEEGGYWFAQLEHAAVGDEYKFVIEAQGRKHWRIDPYARHVTSSVGNAIVHDPTFDWGDDTFELAPWNELVIYEMHVGTFGRGPHDQASADFDGIERRFDHLAKLGINVIQLMPTAEFAGDVSWGYNPAHIFAVENAYGGPLELKNFVKNAHAHGFGVVLDVVYNHFGPSDVDLWQFDGWSQHDQGGIYFYNDWRAETPWGHTRPDYGRDEVRQYLFDNALMWIEEYHMDGLRFDSTYHMRAFDNSGDDNPQGWSLLQWINEEISQRRPHCITIAEDLRNNEYLTRSTGAGGAGFGAQWDADFVHPVRATLIAPDDDHRSMWTVAKALMHRYNQDAFERVVYSESHDEVANGKARVPQEIDGDDPDNWFAQKRSALGAVLVMTAPGIPMLFQGQEFLQGDWFDDQVPLDWDQLEAFHGIVNLYRDLIRLRRNVDTYTKGLTGQHIHVHHVNDADKVIAFHRLAEGGPGDDVIVVVNFANRTWESYDVGVPRPGTWTLRLNTDWSGYSEIFHNHPSTDVNAVPHARDGMPATGRVTMGPYSALIYSQNHK